MIDLTESELSFLRKLEKHCVPLALQGETSPARAEKSNRSREGYEERTISPTSPIATLQTGQWWSRGNWKDALWRPSRTIPCIAAIDKFI